MQYKTLRWKKPDKNISILQEVCSSDLHLQISTAEYDFIIKEFERAEVRERKNKNKNFLKNSKGKDTSIPGFISEDITLLILSEVFKVSINYKLWIFLRFSIT